MNTSPELISFTGKLAFFIRKGIPIPEIIKNTGGDLKNRKLRDAFNRAAGEMKQGKSFSDSLNLSPPLYPTYIIDIIRAGEEQDDLADSLNEAASFLDEKEQLKKLIKNAFNSIFIPADLGFLIFLFLFLVIFPIYVSLFEDMALELPLPVLIIALITKFFQSRVMLIPSFLVFILTNFLFFSDYRFKSKLIYNIFPSGNPIRKYYMYIIAKLMSLMMKRGVTCKTAFIQAARGIDSKPFQKITDKITQRLENNEEFATILGDVKGIPNHFQWMLRETGAKHGEQQTLEAVAEYYREDLELYREKFEKLGANIYMLIVGLIVLFSIVSLISPMAPCGCRLQ